MTHTRRVIREAPVLLAAARPPSRAWIAAVLLLAIGCGGPPAIHELSVAPQVLCQDESASIHWDAEGELAIAIEQEPEASDPECPATGQTTLAITLVARSGEEEADRTVELVSLREPATEPVALATNLIRGDQVVASGEKNVALWGSRVEVATVAACGHRSLVVEHMGKTAWLGADGAPSEALAGSALSGAWELRSALTPKEQAEPALRPGRLKLLATLRCRQEGP